MCTSEMKHLEEKKLVKKLEKVWKVSKQNIN